MIKKENMDIKARCPYCGEEITIRVNSGVVIDYVDCGCGLAGISEKQAPRDVVSISRKLYNELWSKAEAYEKIKGGFVNMMLENMME